MGPVPGDAAAGQGERAAAVNIHAAAVLRAVAADRAVVHDEGLVAVHAAATEGGGVAADRAAGQREHAFLDVYAAAIDAAVHAAGDDAAFDGDRLGAVERVGVADGRPGLVVRPFKVGPAVRHGQRALYDDDIAVLRRRGHVAVHDMAVQVELDGRVRGHLQHPFVVHVREIAIQDDLSARGELPLQPIPLGDEPRRYGDVGSGHGEGVARHRHGLVVPVHHGPAVEHVAAGRGRRQGDPRALGGVIRVIGGFAVRGGIARERAAVRVGRYDDVRRPEGRARHRVLFTGALYRAGIQGVAGRVRHMLPVGDLQRAAVPQAKAAGGDEVAGVRPAEGDAGLFIS